MKKSVKLQNLLNIAESAANANYRLAHDINVFIVGMIYQSVTPRINDLEHYFQFEKWLGEGYEYDAEEVRKFNLKMEYYRICQEETNRLVWHKNCLKAIRSKIRCWITGHRKVTFPEALNYCRFLCKETEWKGLKNRCSRVFCSPQMFLPDPKVIPFKALKEIRGKFNWLYLARRVNQPANQRQFIEMMAEALVPAGCSTKIMQCWPKESFDQQAAQIDFAVKLYMDLRGRKRHQWYRPLKMLVKRLNAYALSHKSYTAAQFISWCQYVYKYLDFKGDLRDELNKYYMLKIQQYETETYGK